MLVTIMSIWLLDVCLVTFTLPNSFLLPIEKVDEVCYWNGFNSVLLPIEKVDQVCYLNGLSNQKLFRYSSIVPITQNQSGSDVAVRITTRLFPIWFCYFCIVICHFLIQILFTYINWCQSLNTNEIYKRSRDRLLNIAFLHTWLLRVWLYHSYVQLL